MSAATFAVAASPRRSLARRLRWWWLRRRSETILRASRAGCGRTPACRKAAPAAAR